jgi:predicted P-loop ATPase
VDQFVANKKDFKALKGLVSTTTDTIRVPYGAVMEQKHRRFVMGATANTQNLFSVDDEQRRFWAIEVNPTTDCGRLDIDWLRENRDAIWGTATRLFKQLGDKAYQLTKEEKQLVIQRNAEDFQQISNFVDKVNQFLEEKDIRAISTTEILNDVLYLPNPLKSHQMEVGQILVRAGYERKKNKKKHGKVFSVLYVHPTRKHDYNGATSSWVTPFKESVGASEEF